MLALTASAICAILTMEGKMLRPLRLDRKVGDDKWDEFELGIDGSIRFRTGDGAWRNLPSLWDKRMYAFQWIQQHRGYGFELRTIAEGAVYDWCDQFEAENREAMIALWPKHFEQKEADCAAGYCNHGRHWSRKYTLRAKKRKTAVDVLLQRQ